VQGLVLRAEHRPEAAWAATQPAALRARRAVASRTAHAIEEAALPERPLWILPTPQPLAARDGLPRHRGRLHLMSEPERIETGWWDGGEIARDYYTARDSQGVRLWVFRERTEPHRWFLHGVFG